MRWTLPVLSACAFAVLLAAPNQDALPDDKGQDVVLRMCANCHDVERVTEVRNTKRDWANVVDDMVSRGAEGSEADANTVIGYLTRNFGKPVNVNTATAKQIEDGLSFTAAQAEALVRYRTGNAPFKSYDDVLKVPGLDRATLEEEKKNIVF